MEYDTNTNRGTTSSDPDPDRTEEPLYIDFIGDFYSDDVGAFWPLDESGTYSYGYAEDVIVERIMGYVFVPVE